MDWGKVKFFLGEVLRSFTRNAGMQATAVATVAVTIALLGAFLFVRGALSGAGQKLLNEIEISAYLAPDVTPAQVATDRSTLRHDPRVAAIDYIPKKDGLKELRRRVGNQIDTSLLDANPLPDKLRIRVKDPATVTRVAAEVRRLKGVDNVVYGETVVQRIIQLGGVLRQVGLGVIALFVVVAGILISNTIRLTVFARRREISIMQLVGATNLYIRMPFICEGLLDGLLGSLAAVGVLAIARTALWPRMLEALPWAGLSASHIDTPLLVLEMLAVGCAVGVIASWISVGRHLRT